ncbi:helix-turn-helix domain-containing protein [Burkholderia alba]|uniref:helix-turn-helix domain-containing protein n=1 Tax=Burkholderia alba TaxID=2683677 RepID=UPI002B05925D|nr:helix-turn-helix domain-containing protein [Burkholderia alba]
MKTDKGINPACWQVCDHILRNGGRLGMTLERIARDLGISEDSVKGRVRNLLDAKLITRIEGTRPSAYRCKVRKLPPPVESTQVRQLREAAERQHARDAAIAVAVVAVDRMVRASVEMS